MSTPLILFKDKKELEPVLEKILESEKPPPQPRANSDPKLKRLSFGYSTKGVGYPSGYISGEAFFAPDFRPGKALPFVDIRGHKLNNGTYAGNFGVGLRFIPSSGCQVYGGNAYYDYRQSSHGNYSQVGLGFEVFGKKWGLWLNGGIPLGGSRVKRHVYNFIGGYVAACNLTQFPFYSTNLAFVFPIIQAGQFLLLGEAQPYFISAKRFNVKSGGISIGILPQVSDYLFLNFNVSYDSVFGTIYQAQVILSLPLYSFSSSKHKKGPCGLSNRQIYQRVMRNNMIILDKFCCWSSNY